MKYKNMGRMLVILLIGVIGITHFTSRAEEWELDVVNEDTQDTSVADNKEGLYYYLQKYQYDWAVVYMKEKISYIAIQLDAYNRLYELGDITETDLQSCKAEKKLAEADLQVALNESDYYNQYLIKNELDYSNYDMTTSKDVKDVEYYMEMYPEIDYMLFARYVTDYNNAVVKIQAQKESVSVLETKKKMASLLFEEGEISQLEFAETEVTLAEAKYKLEQLYVEMNLAFYYLDTLDE